MGTHEPESRDNTQGQDPDVTRELGASSPGPVSAVTGLRPGLGFGPYELVRSLGGGGFAEVWEVIRRSDGRRLALKVLRIVHHVSPDAIARFEQEGRLAASLSHPRAVGVVAAEMIEGQPAILMEIMRGGTLQDRIKAGGPLEPRPAVDAVLDILEGLQAAESVGIIHRDIKPSNCFVDGEGRVKIGDFGLSRTLEPSLDLTVTGNFLGTPAYASPEQVRGHKVDARSDQYSVGATLYALLTGKPPFMALSPGDLIVRITTEAPAPVSTHGVRVAKGLQRALDRLLEKDPARRFPDHGAARRALAPYSTRGLAPASLDLRLAAGLADAGLIVLLAGFVILSLPEGVREDRRVSIGVNALIVVVSLVLEKTWNRTPGKFLLRLRVASLSSPDISWRQATIRNVVYALPNLVAAALPVSVWIGSLLNLGGWALVFSTVRRRNGHAGIHDLLSRTRVVRSRRVEEPSAQSVRVEAGRTPAGTIPAFLGPYRILETIWRGEDSAVTLAADETLGRNVWIHEQADSGTPAPRGENRTNRLAWLQGGVANGRRWDAFEAPSGHPFTRLASGEPIDWFQQSRLLRDLLAEIRSSLAARDLPFRLSVDHLWVDGFGTLKLLEFPAPGGTSGDSAMKVLGADRWPELVQQFIRACKRGGTSSSTQLPTKVLRLLTTLEAEALHEDRLGTVLNEIEALGETPSAVSRPRRAGHVLSAYWLPILIFGAAIIVSIVGAVNEKSPLGIFISLHVSMIAVGFLAIPALMMTALTGSGPFMRLFGLCIRTAAGGPASRARCLSRAAIAWVPGILNFLPLVAWGIVNRHDRSVLFWPTDRAGVSCIVQSYSKFVSDRPEGWLEIRAVFALLFIAGCVYAILSPERGLHDRVAGTRVALR